MPTIEYNGKSRWSRFPFHCHSLSDHPTRYQGATTLKAEIDQEVWATLHRDTSRPFDKPKSGRIAVNVINHFGDEIMGVFQIAI